MAIDVRISIEVMTVNAYHPDVRHADAKERSPMATELRDLDIDLITPGAPRARAPVVPEALTP
jgi:hypothetical protein